MRKIISILAALLIMAALSCHDPYMSGEDPINDPDTYGDSGDGETITVGDVTVSDRCANSCTTICDRSFNSDLQRPVPDISGSTFHRDAWYAYLAWDTVTLPVGYTLVTYIIYSSEKADGPYTCVKAEAGDACTYYMTLEDEAKTYYYRISALYTSSTGKKYESFLSSTYWKSDPVVK